MTQQSANQKTFLASVLIGRRSGTVWPLGRLRICDESITARSLFRTRTSPKSQIIEISVSRQGMGNGLLFVASGEIAGVLIYAARPSRVDRVAGELRRRGYPVVDRRQSLFPLTQGIASWDHDVEL
jgi:Bacterial PH domain